MSGEAGVNGKGGRAGGSQPGTAQGGAPQPGAMRRGPGSGRTLASGRVALAAGWASLGGVGAVFGLLTLLSVFVAVAGPRAGLELRTRALHQTLDRAPAADNSIEVRSDLVSFPEGVDQHLFASFLATFAHDLARQSVPVSPRGAWAGVTTPYESVISGGQRAVIAHVRPRLEVLYRTPLGAFARLAAGRLPRKSSVRRHGLRVTGGSLEVAVTEATAARFGLHPGSKLVVSGPDQNISLTVTGILRPLALRSAFWTYDRTAPQPLLIQGATTSPPYWTGAAFVGPAEVGHLEAAYSATDVPLLWDVPVAVDAVNADQAQSLADRITAAVNGSLLGTVAGYEPQQFSVSSGLFTALPGFLAGQSAMQTVLLLLVASLVVLGATAVLLAARMLAAERDQEFSLLRARGASARQLAAYALATGALPVIPAAVLGAAAAVAATPGSADSLSWRLAGLALLTALAGPPLIAVRQHGRGQAGPRPAGARGGSRGRVAPAGQEWSDTGPLTRRDRARRLIADVTVALACAGGLAILRIQGLPHDGSPDLYVSLAPVLVAAPAAVLAARALPPALRWAVALTARQRGVAAFLGLARATRGGAVWALPTFGLVLALALVSFGAMTRTAIERGQQAASWHAVGADALIAQDNSDVPVTPALAAAVAGTRGVTATAAATVVSGMGPGGSPVQIVAVDPARYAALTARTPYPPLAAARLAKSVGWSPGQPAPALASPFAAKILGTGVARLPTDSGTVAVRIAAVVRGGTPAAPGNGSFVVVPSWAVRGLGPPGLLLVAGSHLPGDRLAAEVRRFMPGGSVILRSATLASLAKAPLPSSTSLAFTIGSVCAGSLAMLVLLLALVLGARTRQAAVARLATMGCSGAQARRLAMLETAPQVATAVAFGVACAAALVPLTAPIIDLTPFTGGSGPVEFSADPAALGAAAAALAVLAAATLTIQTAVSARRRPSRALRVGD